MCISVVTFSILQQHNLGKMKDVENRRTPSLLMAFMVSLWCEWKSSATLLFVSNILFHLLTASLNYYYSKLNAKRFCIIYNLNGIHIIHSTFSWFLHLPVQNVFWHMLFCNSVHECWRRMKTTAMGKT